MARRATDRVTVAERLWPLLRDIGAFLIGSFMLIQQTLLQGRGQPPSELLVIVGVALLGVTGSGIAQRLLEKGDKS